METLGPCPRCKTTHERRGIIEASRFLDRVKLAVFCPACAYVGSSSIKREEAVQFWNQGKSNEVTYSRNYPTNKLF